MHWQFRFPSNKQYHSIFVTEYQQKHVGIILESDHVQIYRRHHKPCTCYHGSNWCCVVRSISVIPCHPPLNCHSNLKLIDVISIYVLPVMLFFFVWHKVFPNKLYLTVVFSLFYFFIVAHQASGSPLLELFCKSREWTWKPNYGFVFLCQW